MNDELDTSSAVTNYLKVREPEAAARTSYTLGAESNPDAEAEYRKLAKQAGIPLDSVRDNKDAVQRQVSAPDFKDLATRFPSTTAYLSNVENSRIAHDDVGGLTEVEKAIRSFMDGGSRKLARAPSAVMNSREYSDAVRRAMVDNPALDETAARTLVMNGAAVDNQTLRMGPVRGPVPGAGSVVGGLISAARQMPETFDRQLGYIAADILGLDQTQNRNRLAALETRNVSQTPDFETTTGKGLYAGGVSTIQNAPGIALSIATGSAVPALTLAGVQSSVPAYSKYRERGASGAMAAVGALGEGAVEVATELIPMQSLLKVFGKNGQGAAMQFLKSQFQEQWTEQIATVAQDAIDTAIANPNKTWGEYVAERPGAAYQTFLATLVQTGAVTIAHKAAQKVTGAAFTRNEDANRAAEAAAGAESLTKLAEASKLRARDPESFAQFVNHVAEDGDVPAELFINADTLTNTLNQAGITMERLAMVAPAVTAQLRAASFVPGADIRIPVAEFAAAGADITTPLIDHLRETPDAMSRAEAAEYLSTEGDKIQAQVETELGKMVDRTTYQQGIDAVRDEFQAQLQATGRFRPEVTQAYATMLGNFYGAQAARAGVTPQELMAKYRLNVTGKDVAGQQSLNQFAGEKALTANAMALDTGKQRLAAGEDAETVRRETGWSTGADGRWRFEISDADALLKTELDGPNKNKSIGRLFSGEDYRTLGSILHHPALFAAYPALESTPIKFVSSITNPGVNGAFGADGMSLGSDLSPKAALSTLLHEIQHGIQSIEGFATGGNLNDVDASQMRDARESEARTEYRAADAAYRANKTPENKRRFENAASALERVGNNPNFGDKYEAYSRLSGEVEARNTQARQGMTDDQRATTPPESTADVPASDVIVTFNGKEVANAPRPNNAEALDGRAQAATKTIATDGQESGAGGRGTTEAVTNRKDVVGESQGGRSADDNTTGTAEPFRLYHGGKTSLVSLEGQGKKNRFLYASDNSGLAKQYGESVTPLKVSPDALIVDFSNPEDLYGSPAALDAISKYAQEHDIDPDALIESTSNGRLWEDFGTYVQDDINDVLGEALGADIIALPDTTFGSTPSVIGKSFVVLSRAKVSITNEPTAADTTSARQPQTETAAFKKWFGDSKVVDADGKPLVVYHGTAKDFNAFDNDKTGTNDMGLWGRGHYFSSTSTSANSYALRQGDGARVIPAYVSIQNPLVLRTGDDLVIRMPDGTNTRDLIGQNLDGSKIKAIALNGGHDGVMQIKPDGSIGDVVAFRPEQIKSATGNNGDFNPANPNILMQSPLRQVTTPKGATAFQSDEVVFAKPRLNTRQSDGDVTRIDYDIRDPAVFAQAKAAGQPLEQAREAASVGILTMDVDKNGQFKSLRNIEVFESKRGAGMAEKVVGAIMGTLPDGAKLHIHDILPTATGFWDKMGARYPKSEDFMEAFLTPQQFKDAHDNRRTDRGTKNQSGERDASRDTGRESRRPGDDGTDVSGEQRQLDQPAYHGSPHDFDRFSTDKIGMGEGNQSYGWGLYFSESKDVAEGYRKTLSMRADGRTPKDIRAAIKNVKATMQGPLRAAELRELDAQLKMSLESTRGEGGVYQVDIPDDAVANMLLWDKPLSEQPESVKAALKAMLSSDRVPQRALDDFDVESRAELAAIVLVPQATGKEIYGNLEDVVGGGDLSDKAASKALAAAGIPGIKYLDGDSRKDGDGSYNLVVFDDSIIQLTHKDGSPVTQAERNEYLQGVNGAPRGTLNFSNDITQAPSVIALLEGADLSTFIHEAGHFFLEVQADLAARIQLAITTGDTVSPGERAILEDMTTMLDWMGVKATPGGTALDQWLLMTLEEKREGHEQWARGFERYTMEGKAPTLELQAVFSRFRSWLLSVYKTLTGLNVTLTDDVRAVMDRMLASDEAIQDARDARAMGPLFESFEGSGMTPAEYADYQALGARAAADAGAELDVKLLRDMKWLTRARDKALKAAQAEADDLRKEVEREVRREVMAQPVYRAWQFLTGKGHPGDKLAGMKSPGRAQTLNPEVDNLFEAIAKLGGLNKASVVEQWGDPDKIESGVFGKPVLRKEGLSIDAMAERLVEEGYLVPGANGEPDMAKFQDLFDDQARGIDRYSISKQFTFPEDGEVPPDSIDNIEAFYGKLNTEELKRRYGDAPDAVWRILSARRMTNASGFDPDQVAQSIEGFSSGDELVRRLAVTIPPQEMVERMTDARMMERHGDIASREALNQAADEAVHSELRARVVAAELKALNKAEKGGERNTAAVMARAAKEYAAQAVARQKVRDLRPGQYAAAAARSGKLAAQALGKSTEEAALHKRNQLINTYATKAATAAKEEVASASAYFRKFDSRRKSIDPEYQDQIEAMLERFDFRPASLKAIDRRKTLAAWYDEQVEIGNAPNIDPALLDEANRKSYKDMTVEELRGLRDAVEQIEHIGRLKNKLLLARDKREFDELATGMAGSIIDNGGDPRKVQLEAETGFVPWMQGFAASHRKLSSLFRQMDGGKDDGPMYELIGRAMNERGTMEDVMVEQATKALADIYKPVLAQPGGVTGYRSKLFIPEIANSLTRGGRLAVALNWGNEANRQRIMDGDKWTDGQVRAILKTLTPVELKFVNDIWTYIDTYWEQIAAKEKRLTGAEPEKVMAQPFTVIAADGTAVDMRGGYYPLKYDTERSDKAEQQEAAQVAKEMMQGVFTRATTRRGHTKERLKEVKRAVRKDLNVITQHVTQVVHDLAWHEWLMDTNKLLGDGRVTSAIRDHYGPKVLKTMRDDVLGIATADVVPQTDVDKTLLLLRGNVSRATMGLSLTTAFLQPFGLTQSMVRIGGKHVLQGAAQWAGDAVRLENTLADIREKSDFMRLRAQTFNKELREIQGYVAGKSKTMRVVDGALFMLMQKMQLVADVPTWLGQYNKSLEEGLDEAAAVAMADRAVLESQGGGQTKDLAEVQRQHPMLTQFYSYFSVTLNLTAESTANTNFRNPRAVAGWLGDMALLLVVPAILPALIMHMVKGGDDEDGWPERIAKWQLGYLMGMVVVLRELSGAVSGFDYAGPPVGRIAADLNKAGKQTVQGEVDEPAVMAYIRLMGTAFGIPMIQAVRSYKGWQAWDEGREGAGPQSVLFGPPPKE